jgi:hypothetical protein
MSKVDKIKKKIEDDHGTFYDSCFAMSEAQMKDQILVFTKCLEETIYHIKTKPEILEAEEYKKKLEKPYNDKIKEYKDKVKQLKRFVDEDVCKEDLERQMVRFACLAEEQKFAKDIDPAIKDAKGELDIVKGPYTDAQKVYELKISYLHILIKEKQGLEPSEAGE